MKYELRLFFSLIAETPLTKKVNTETIANLIDTLFKKEKTEFQDVHTSSEPEAIVAGMLQSWKMRFYKKVSKSEFNKGADKHIQYCQSAIIQLKEMILEKLLREENFSAVDPDTIDFFQKLYFQFDELLYSLEKNFPGFINTSVCVSDCKRRQLFDKAIEKREFILAALKTSNLSSKLKDVLVHQLDKIYYPHSKEKICHKELFYHMHFTEVLFKVFRERKDEINDKKVIILLFRLNLNSTKFFNYFTSYIRDEIESIKEPSDKLKRYFFHLKRCRQIKLTIKSGYRWRLKSIKGELEGWLKEEITYLRETQAKEPVNQSLEEKLTLALSVEGISLYMRAQKEIGLIKNQNHSEILRIVTRAMASSKSNNISFRSLRNKYYNVGESTRKEVKKILQELLNHVSTMQLV
jgi:hypothetical protein